MGKAGGKAGTDGTFTADDTQRPVCPGRRATGWPAMTRSSYADYALVPAAQLVTIPGDLNFQSAARANLNEAVAMVLDANRALSAQSVEGAEVIRETLILPAA